MYKLDRVELKKILDAHKLWLEGKGGKRADLSNADLHGIDLRCANLRGSDLNNANLIGADLTGADLSMTNLHGTNLSGSNLDYSAWPLWCCGLHVKMDRRIMAQLAYHFCCQDCDDPDYIKARDAILWFANSFHRVDECGELKPLGKNEA